MNKKVAIIYSGAKYWGGIETYISSLFDGIENLELISLGEWSLTKELENRGMAVKVFSGKRIRIKTIFEIEKYLKENNFGLIVGGGVVSSAYARAISFISGIPCVITVHSLQELDYPNRLFRSLYGLIDFVSRWQTTKYIAVSDFIKKSLVKSGVKSSRIVTIYNGVEEFEVKTKKRGKNIVIGSIGRLHYTKGYHNLILAMNYLKDFPIELEIWGDGPEKENLESLIKNEGLAGMVKLMGWTDETKKVLSRFDIYIQPSLSEGFGLTVVEAMMAEVSVVVSPKGSLPELIEDSKTGLVAKGQNPEALAASLKVLIENEEFSRELAERARVSALEKFNLEKFISKTNKVFEECSR